jgi:hypothetical protein
MIAPGLKAQTKASALRPVYYDFIAAGASSKEEK